MLLLLIATGGFGWTGPLLVAVIFGPLYLHGAYARSVLDWELSANGEVWQKRGAPDSANTQD